MVEGRRRARKKYSVNVRHEGLTLRRRAQVLKAKHLAVLALGVAAQAQQHGQPFLPALALAYISLAFVRHWSGWVVVINPVFQRAEQLTINYSDAELYSYRITDRNYIAQLLQLLQIPQTFVSPNRGRMTGEECFLLWLSYVSSPTRLQDLQRRHGLEYSQISRWIRVMWAFLFVRWSPKVLNNLAFFVPRFPAYAQRIAAKYTAMHGVVMDPRYANVALFSDGTKRKQHRARRTLFCGHKKFYCLGYLVTIGPDGMIVHLAGPFAGRKNDHMMQNESNLSGQLSVAQAGNALQFSTSSDKGLHLQPHVIPLLNNLHLNQAQIQANTRWSAMRVTNENVIGLVPNTFRYLDLWKNQNGKRQPLGVFYIVCCFMRNVITCLDWNQCSAYFNCAPPTLQQYLA
jgi:hypothetical protein